MQNTVNNQVSIYNDAQDYTEVDLVNDRYEELKQQARLRCQAQQREDNQYLSLGKLLFKILLIMGILFLCVVISKT